MKRNSIGAIVMCLPLTLSLFGCLEIKVRTTVSADGSSERLISLKQEKQSLPRIAYPILAESSWSIEWKLINDEKPAKHEYNARKRFSTPEELEREYAASSDTVVLGVKVNLSKSFQWFYTYFDYREIYTLRNPFNLIPITNVLTKDEINHYLHHYSKSLQDSVIEVKVNDWFDRNQFEDFFQNLVRAAEQRKDSDLSAYQFIKNKERIYAIFKVKGDSAAEKELANPLPFLMKILEEGLRTKAVYAMRNEVATAWADEQKKEDHLKTEDDNYENSVQLPGLILETNSDRIQGNLVTWKVKSNQLKVGDYVMRAQSRITNVWTFIITGLAALALLVLIVSRMVYRRSPSIS